MQHHQYLDFDELYDNNAIRDMKNYNRPAPTRGFDSYRGGEPAMPRNINPATFDPNAAYAPEGFYGGFAPREKISGIRSNPDTMDEINYISIERIKSTTNANYYMLIAVMFIVILIFVICFVNMGLSISQRKRSVL